MTHYQLKNAARLKIGVYRMFNYFSVYLHVLCSSPFLWVFPQYICLKVNNIKLVINYYWTVTERNMDMEKRLQRSVYRNLSTLKYFTKNQFSADVLFEF